MRSRNLVVIFFCLFLITLSAQSRLAVVGSGYIGPNNSIGVAPGQIATFFLSGVQTMLPAPGFVKADGFPLPFTLGGFSATIHQTAKNVLFKVPLLLVKQTNVCTATASGPPPPDCFITSLTVQIPYALGVHNPLVASPIDDVGTTELVVSENGAASKSFALGPSFSQIHVLTNCDGGPVNSYGGLPCSWLVTHADGSLVSFSSPAKVGETVVAYAVGFGAPGSQAQDGVPSPAGVSLPVDSYKLTFSYTAIVFPPPASAEPAIPTPLPQKPLYVGLVAGFVGLYQVNFVVPSPPILTMRCDGGGVFTNMAVTIQGVQSSDSASFCVATPALG
jgi:hypothetical protein